MAVSEPATYEPMGRRTSALAGMGAGGLYLSKMGVFADNRRQERAAEADSLKSLRVPLRVRFADYSFKKLAVKGV